MLIAGAATETAAGRPLEAPDRYLPLVERAVRDFLPIRSGPLDRDALTAAGTSALHRSMESYRPERGIPFARYATQRIRSAIQDEIRSADWAERQIRKSSREIAETREHLAIALGRTPSFREVAQALGIHPDDVLQITQSEISAAHAVDTHRDLGLALSQGRDSPEPDSQIMRAAVAELPARLRQVIESYFYDTLTWEEIATGLSTSATQVMALCTEALDLLQGAIDYTLARPAVPAPGGSEILHRRRRAYYAAVAAHVATTTPHPRTPGPQADHQS